MVMDRRCFMKWVIGLGWGLGCGFGPESSVLGADSRSCGKSLVFSVGGVDVWTRADHPALFFQAGLTIDADGSPEAYHPDNGPGLDDLGRAGRPGAWRAVATDTGKGDGTPIIQGPNDPSPGFFVSTTSLVDPARPVSDPRRYVDSGTVPYLALPKIFFDHGLRLGDLGYAINTANGRSCAAIFADVGPEDRVGEGSMALGLALGVSSCPRRGGVADGIIQVIFPGTGNGRPQPVTSIGSSARAAFEAWGGRSGLFSCFPGLESRGGFFAFK